MPGNDANTINDFFRAQEVIEASRDAVGSRFTGRVEMLFPASDQSYEPDVADDSRAQKDLLAQVGDEAQAILDELEADYRWEGLGRGAEGLAVALSIGSIVITALGSLPTWFAAGKKVQALWRKVRARGLSPVLSLGALQLLAYMDLKARNKLSDNAEVQWAGDVSGAADLGYSGDDLFLIIFMDAPTVYVYLVDSTGKVVHRGIGELDHRSYLNLVRDSNRSDEEREDFSPPYLLD